MVNPVIVASRCCRALAAQSDLFYLQLMLLSNMGVNNQSHGQFSFFKSLKALLLFLKMVSDAKTFRKLCCFTKQILFPGI